MFLVYVNGPSLPKLPYRNKSPVLKYESWQHETERHSNGNECVFIFPPFIFYAGLDSFNYAVYFHCTVVWYSQTTKTIFFSLFFFIEKGGCFITVRSTKFILNWRKKIVRLLESYSSHIGFVIKKKIWKDRTVIFCHAI